MLLDLARQRMLFPSVGGAYTEILETRLSYVISSGQCLSFGSSFRLRKITHNDRPPNLYLVETGNSRKKNGIDQPGGLCSLSRIN